MNNRRVLLPEMLTPTSVPMVESEASARVIRPSQAHKRPAFKLQLEPTLVLWAALLLAAVAHAANMLSFPYFENDEGIYLSQGWAVLTGKGLANYTYWYDHPPVGWMQIALWLGLTGGPLTFGVSVVSGRILMLLVHIGSSFFLFRLGQKITGNVYVGAVSVALFSLSPLGTYFQRRLLLDNFMIFWILATLYLILCRYKSSLGAIVLSAVTYGIALLSKEICVVFLPALLYMLWTRLDRRHRTLALTAWLSIVFIIGLQWFAYALFKGELFQSGTWLGGTHEHVSLLETLQYQASRSNGYGIFSLDNDFWHTMREYWLTRDPFIVVAGPVATLINLLLGWRKRQLWLAALPSLCMLLFLARGALVIEYYIIPAIPLFALNFAVLGYEVFKAYRRWVFKPVGRRLQPALRVGEGLLLLGLMATFGNYILWNAAGKNNFQSDQTMQQVEAMSWVEHNLPQDAFIVTDQYDLLDLQQAGMLKAHSHWKVSRDPDIRKKILRDDWHNIDYIMATPQVINDIDTANLDILKVARDHSSIIKTFVGQAGWNIEVRKINPVEVSSLNVTERNSTANGSITRKLSFNMYDYKQSLSKANLLIQVTSANNQLLYKQTYDGQNLQKGQTYSFTVPIELPAGTDPGTVKVTIGLFDQSWHDTFMWQEYQKLLG